MAILYYEIVSEPLMSLVVTIITLPDVAERISLAEGWKLVAESSEFHFTLGRGHFSNSKYAKKRDILSKTKKRESRDGAKKA